MKYKKFIAVLTVCFCFGLAIGKSISEPQDRAERIVELFNSLCVPRFLQGTAPQPHRLGLVKMQAWPDELRWLDPQSASHLLVSERRCSIETSFPYSLSEEDGEKLAARISDLVSDKLSQLEYDPNVVMAKISHGWMTGELSSADRAGVTLHVYPDWGEGSGSLLTLYLPTAKGA